MTMCVLNDQLPCPECGAIDGRVFGLSPDSGGEFAEHRYEACEGCGWTTGWFEGCPDPILGTLGRDLKAGTQ